MKLYQKIGLAAGALFLAGCAYLTPLNRGRVAEGVIRTRQPDAEDLEWLVDNHKVKSILNLRGKRMIERWYRAEEKFSRENGIDLESVGLSNYYFPKREELVKILDFYDDAEKPILIHCQGGADRTSFASVVYRLHSLGQSIEKARGSFSMSHGHLKYYTGDFVIDRFEIEGKGKTFREWVEEDYDKGRMRELFDER